MGNRGEKLTELLKQRQYVPMPAEEQVCVLYAGVRGYLDKVQTADIGKFEQLYLDHIRNKHSNILETLRTEGQVSKRQMQTLLLSSRNSFQHADLPSPPS